MGNAACFAAKWSCWRKTCLRVLFRTGTRLGQFDPEHYRAEVASNVDFRKFDDGLKMTLDCDYDTRDRIKTLLYLRRTVGWSLWAV